MHYAVYDIGDTPTRTSVSNTLKDSGFVRIQKSVFCGQLSDQSKKDLLERVGHILNPDVGDADNVSGADSFYLIMTCASCFGNIETIGESFDAEYASGNTPAQVF